MSDCEFHHFGVPTRANHDGEVYIEAGRVHVTDAASHPYRVEFLRFEPDTLMPVEVQTRAHVAFIVPDLDAALDGHDVLIEPFDATEEFRVAFITDGEAVIELMERR